MDKIVFVRALPDWQLELRFSDGTQGVVSVKDQLFGPVFEPLKDPAIFAQVTIDEFGAICWPCGADLAPDALYAVIRGKSQVA